jgi:hypothetical protein
VKDDPPGAPCRWGKDGSRDRGFAAIGRFLKTYRCNSASGIENGPQNDMPSRRQGNPSLQLDLSLQSPGHVIGFPLLTTL